MQVPLTPGDVHDLDAMADAITERTRLIFVCNPNNPTGTVVRRAELERFLDRVPSDVLVVLDEAYREFIRDPEVPDGVELYRERPNVCVLRTFSKAYGLAGLRVGFAIAHEPVAAALRKTAVPFGVSQLAQDAAVASLRAEDELLGRVGSLVSERARVVETLRGQGWTVPETQANFVWLRLGERTVDFAAACEQAGVVVRPFAGEGVRVTVGRDRGERHLPEGDGRRSARSSSRFGVLRAVCSWVGRLVDCPTTGMPGPVRPGRLPVPPSCSPSNGHAS